MEIETPVTTMTGTQLANPKPMVVPILRAGLGMLDGLTRLLPTAEVGFLGMVRNDETLKVTTYANRLPDDLTGRQCFVLDPMLATGHTLIASCEYLHERGAPRHHLRDPAGRPRGPQGDGGADRSVDRPDHRHGRHRREAQQERLHRAGPG